MIPFVATGAVQAAVFTVTTVNPTGPGSLSQAISDANGLAGSDQIVFNIPGGVSTRSIWARSRSR